MSVKSPLALVGTGAFAPNVQKVLSAGDCSLGYSVDDFRATNCLKKTVSRAADIPIPLVEETAKFGAAVSDPGHCAAAVKRLRGRNIPAAKVIPLTDDHVIPTLDLNFGELGQCRSVFDLERHFFGGGWTRAQTNFAPTFIPVGHYFFANDMDLRIRENCWRQVPVFNIYRLATEVPLWWDRESAKLASVSTVRS